MLTKTQIIRHVFNNCVGWAPDLGPSVDIGISEAGLVEIPHLTDAENCIFELDGGPHKIGGASKVNSSAVASGAAITGLHDYWRQGTAGTPSRRRVIHAGTVIMADADDAVFANIFTGLVSGAVPAYETFDDLLIIASDNTSDVPRSWDQTTAQNLAGTPPRFSFSAAHKNRLWAAGNFSAPSRLYYSGNTDPEDWTGATSGSIDIDPNDGDIITGLASHKNELIVFKGPNKGSIHRITGSAPTGADGFARSTYSKGLGACWHNAIFRYGDELGFVSQYGTIHNLSTTAAFGDFFERSLSRPLNKWIITHLNYNRLRYIGCATDPLLALVYITLSIDASSTNNAVLVMDFKQAPNLIRWSYIPAFAFGSLHTFVDTSGVRRVLAGGNDGFVRRINTDARSIDGNTAISYSFKTPYLNYGNSMLMKTLEGVALGISPKGNYNMTFGWQRDGNVQQTATIGQSGADVLGSATAHQFTLDTSILGGSLYQDVFAELEEGGEGRSFQYQVAQAGNNEDIEVHSVTTKLTPGALSMEN